MPFRSEAQRAYLYAREPEVARRWSAEYGGQPNLPARVSKSKAQQYAKALRKK